MSKIQWLVTVPYCFISVFIVRGLFDPKWHYLAGFVAACIILTIGKLLEGK